MKRIARLALVANLFGLLVGCDLGCGNEVLGTVPSPSGKLSAIVFNRNCGATTGFNTQVSIASSSDTSPSGGGNALILDGTVPLDIVWSSDSSLSISGLGSAKVFKQQQSIHGVSISYAK